MSEKTTDEESERLQTHSYGHKGHLKTEFCGLLDILHTKVSHEWSKKDSDCKVWANLLYLSLWEAQLAMK